LENPDTDAGRNAYLDTMRKLGEQYKSRPWGLVWAAAGAQPALEAALDIGGAGYPAFAAISPKKARAAKAMGTFEAEKLMSFVNGTA